MFADRDRSRSGTYCLESLGMLKNISLFQFDASDNTALARCIRATEPAKVRKAVDSRRRPEKVGVVSNIFRG